MERLEKMAARLKEMAAEQPGAIIRHLLGGGLRVAVRWKPFDPEDGGIWELGMWRFRETPSDQEMEMCRGAFEVSEDAGMSERLRKGEWNGYCYVWWEGDPVDRCLRQC